MTTGASKQAEGAGNLPDGAGNLSQLQAALENDRDGSESFRLTQLFATRARSLHAQARLASGSEERHSATSLAQVYETAGQIIDAVSRRLSSAGKGR